MTTLSDVLKPVRARRGLPTPAERRAIREAAGLTAADVARILDVTRATTCRWESGIRTPRGDNAVRYLRLLGRLRRESLTSSGLAAASPQAGAGPTYGPSKRSRA